MRINEVDKEVTQVQLDTLERALDKVFANVGIDVEFTRHFLDRVNDERNIKQITLSELGQLFKKEFIKYGKPIAQLGPDAEAVMKDLASDINIPFALDWNPRTKMLELIAKTVMRKRNFKTSNKEFTVESALPKLTNGGVLGTGLDPAQFQNKYGISPKAAQTSISNVVKLRPAFSNPKVANAITQYMLDTPGALQAANDNKMPKRGYLPKWMKGLAGRLLGTLGIIFTPSAAGETPEELELFQKMQDIENWMLYNDPQAFIDLYQSEWDSLTDKEKKENEQWDPKNNPNVQNAKEAVRIQRASQEVIKRRHDELLDRIFDPRQQAAPATSQVSPTQPKEPEREPDPDLPNPANDPGRPHNIPGQPGMPNPEDKPDWWPDEVIPFPSPTSPTQPKPSDPDKSPDSPEPDDKPKRTDKPKNPGSPVDPDGKPEFDPEAPTPGKETPPEVDPTSPEQPRQPDEPDTSPKYDPKTDPKVKPSTPDKPSKSDPEDEPKVNPKTPKPKVDPTSPEQPKPSDPGKSPKVDPKTDPSPSRDIPNNPSKSDPEKSPTVPGKGPNISPTAPAQPQPGVSGSPYIPGLLGDPDVGLGTSTRLDPAPKPEVKPKTSKRNNGTNKKRRDWDWGASDDYPYDDPLQRWQRKYGMFENANLAAYLFESGSMEGVGLIHKDEINPTLAELEKHLNLDLSNFTLGSVGKKEFSGDIDVAINLPPEELPAFIEKLKKSPLILDVNVPIDTIITKLKIVNYDESKKPENDDRPRTGYVQLDFMPGDPGWLKTYYHSPAEDESKYKGVFRNIMMAEIAANYNRQDSEQKLEDGRPMERVRYKWSPKEGLLKVKRTPVMNKKGTGYTKKNQDETIEGPWKQADDIAKELNLDSAANMNSFETLLAVIEKNYTAEVVERIKQGFIRNHQVQDIGVPEELL